MTFTEAAVEVLRLVGKPLHYKKITEVAIERNLLSHVGKTPEVTMSSRLATMVKRDRGEAPIIKVKPGVFGLREFNEEQLADLSGDVDELPEVEVDNEQDKAAEPHEGALDVPSIVPSIEPRKPLPGADVFPEEDDDDEPILGGDDEDEDDDEAEGEEGARADAQPGSESRSSRRRRKRRRRGGPDEAVEPEARTVREPREEAPRLVREAREPRSVREPRRDEQRRDEQRTNERARDRGPERNQDRHDRERNHDRGRDDRRLERDEPDFQREPGDGDLLGKDLADAVASVLTQGGPRGLPAMRIADLLVRKGRLAGEPSQLVPTIMAAVRADIARKRVEQTRARFRLEGGAVVLTEFLLPQDVVRAELDVLRAAERQRERTRRAFLRKLSELPGAGMAELIATWLNAEGVVGLRAVRRPGAGVGELHLAGTLRRGADEVRLAIVVYREARELSRERVIEARGSLHYYGNASTSWLVTFGTVTSGAREEASAPSAGPVSLYDGLSLATAMERQGVGLITQSIAISALDFELLDALRGGQPMREAPRDLDQERGRGRDRDAHRNERDRDAGRGGERDRPRLTLERAQRSSHAIDEEIDVEQVEEEAEDDVALDESDEVIEAVLQEAGTPGADASTEEGEAREGGRRRRRRRRRKGGRGGEAQAGEAPTQTDGDENQEPGEAAGWGEGDESESESSDADDDVRTDEEGPDRYLRDEERGTGDSHDDRTPDEPLHAGSRDERERARNDEQDGEEDAQDGEEDGEEDEQDDDDLDDESSDRAHESTALDEGEEQADTDQDRAGGERRHDSDTAPSDQDDDRQDPYSGRRGHG